MPPEWFDPRSTAQAHLSYPTAHPALTDREDRLVPTGSTEADAVPEQDREALKRHRVLFRAVARRKNPKLRRTDITVTDERVVKRAVKAAALGNAMEWFDFGIYSYLAVTIGNVFFPGGSDTTKLLSSFATFAVAFLVRPWAAPTSALSATVSAARRSSPSP